MKACNLSDDRIVVVKKEQGSQYVIMKQKDSAAKYVQFTANRYNFGYMSYSSYIFLLVLILSRTFDLAYTISTVSM